MKKPRRKYEYKSEETRARQRRTQFGQPEGNKGGNGLQAVSMREFYKWCENEATMEELKAYAEDTTKSAVRRKFVQALVRCEKVQDFFELTNQTHGYPKQQIEKIELPEIEIILE